MKELFTALASFLADAMEYRCHRIGAKIEDRDPVGVIIHSVFLLLYIVALAVSVLVLLALVKHFWHYMIIPLTIIIVIYYYANNQKEEQTTINEQPVQQEEPIEMVRLRAERAYPSVEDTAYLLIVDLTRYFSGLVVPFAPSAVKALVNFDITSTRVPLFHFVVAKGKCDAPVTAIQETLSRVIMQHLRARDLPISIPEVYTAADGTMWPGLVVDGVYDLGDQYRIDLVITNEAEVAALKSKKLGRTGKENSFATPDDPDF